MHLVVGAGAVGIGLGATLLAAGEPVAFVARGATARALGREGCVRSGLFGEVRFPPDAFALIESPEAWRGAPPRAVWIATKSWATAEVARDLAASSALRDGDAPLVLAQNGLGNAEAAASHFSERRVFGACVITGFRREAPQRVQVTVHADAILLGSPFGLDPAPLGPLAEALCRGGIPTETTPDFRAELWAKVLYNCALNPLGAILGVPYGELGRGEATRRLIDRIAREVFELMEAEGVHSRWTDAEAWLQHFYAKLLPTTADHESSMLQDVRAGRRTEIESLCGEVARRGAAHRIETPINAALAELVRALSRPRQERTPG